MVWSRAAWRAGTTRQAVTVGSSPRNLIVVPQSNLPASTTVFAWQGDRYQLCFDEGVDGRIQGPQGAADFGALVSQGLAKRSDEREIRSLRSRLEERFHKGRIHGIATSGVNLAFGQFGLKAMEPERLTARQIEAARRALTRHMKRAGQVWIRVYPDVPVSKKPLEVRMGTGKGAVETWVAVIRPANILFEVDGVTAEVAREAMRLAAAKLPIRTKFISRHQAG